MNYTKFLFKLFFVTAILILGLQLASAQTVTMPRNGGTGTSTRPVSGQVLIGNSALRYTPAYLTAGANITITTSSGAITITGSAGGSGGNFATGTPSAIVIFIGPNNGSSSVGFTYNTSTHQLAIPGSVTSTGLFFSNATGTGNFQIATLKATGATNLSSTVNITGATALASTLNVTGLSSLAGLTFSNATGTGNLQIATAQFTGAVGASSTLNIQGIIDSRGGLLFVNATGTGNLHANSLTLTTALDISSYTNLSGGRSLSMNGDAMDADAELYTYRSSVVIQQPTSTAGLNFFMWKAPVNATINHLSGRVNNATATVAVDRRNEGSEGTFGTMVSTSSVYSSVFTSSTAFATTSIAAGQYLVFTVSSTSGVAENGTSTLTVWFRYTNDD